ncbi:MAG: diacylglycerol kinase family protein [Nocardioides sp.]
MLDRPRSVPLGWAAGALGALAVLAFLVARDRSPLDALDTLGQDLAAWTAGHHVLAGVLRVVELFFGTVAMTTYATALTLALMWRRHFRAAVFTAGVMLTGALVTTVVKVTVGRSRPDWQDPVGLLDNGSFPSGHASSTAAFAGIVVMLGGMLVRRAGLRRPLYAVAASLAALVALDRVLLGRHYPTDVVGGMLLGSGVLLAWLAVYSPLPRSHSVAAGPLVETMPGRRELHVVLNPAKVEDVPAFKSMVGLLAAESGWSTPTWHYTTVEDPGRGMAHDSAVEGADLVLVCGGDGTVREVCAELAGTGIPIGIVPAGTGNLLARNLDIPLFQRAAVDVALTGQDKAIDLAAVSGDGLEDSHFLVMAGMGFDAAIMEGVNEDIKKKVGWLAYVVSALKSLMFPAIRVDISVDGGEFTRHRARTVVVGNVGYLQAGMPLLP